MLYDISQPVFECDVFPGDPCPEGKMICKIENGDLYNLTEFSMCAHNGTHVDAPLHFIRGGKGIGEICLDKFIEKACVISHEGDVTAQDAAGILDTAAACGAQERILIKGKATVSLEAAKVFAEAGVALIGNESHTNHHLKHLKSILWQ